MTASWRKTAALVLAISLAVAGCGGGGSKPADEDATTGDESLLPPDRTTAPPAAPEAAAPTTAGKAPAKPGATTSLQPTRRSPVTAPPGPGAPADEPGLAGPTDTEKGKGGTGSFAPSMLRSKPNGLLRIELLVQSGITPGRGALDHISAILRNASGKPVEITAPIAIPGGSKAYSGQEIIQLADRFGKANDGGAQATIHVLYLHGSLAESDGAIGVAVRGDVLAVFSDKIRGTAVPGISGETIETTVVTHEFGHLLGLVDIYLKTGRQDPEHPGHSPNKKSVMYWAVETTSLVSVFGQGGPPQDFDSADLADLANIKDGAAPGSKG